jgi:antirestriction protein ArdC
MTSALRDVYGRITGKIIADLEQGVTMDETLERRTHSRRNHTPTATQRHSLQRYNVLLLWSATVNKDYTNPLWLTFRQTRELGGHVKQGETGELVVFASTWLAHELIHATKHEKRLARDMGRVRSGDEGYAKEELVAELGAAFLCADLEITPEVREDHAAYRPLAERMATSRLLTALQDDKRLIFTAAAQAQRAADYLHGLQPRRIESEYAAA